MHPSLVTHESFAHSGGAGGDDDDLYASAMEFGDLFNYRGDAGEGGIAVVGGYGGCACFEEEAAGGAEGTSGGR